MTILNGEKLPNNGSVLRTVLEHLGYDVDISYSWYGWVVKRKARFNKKLY